MLERGYLDDRCATNDPGRVGNEPRGESSESPTAKERKEFPQTEPCHFQNVPTFLPSKELSCPTLECLNKQLTDGEKVPPYFPQPGDNATAEPEGPMGPIGPWATGRVSYSPKAGMTGVRPVVDRYSVTRYSPAQWRARNHTFFVQSTAKIDDAQFIANKARDKNKKIYKEADKNQLVNRDRLSERASVVFQWKVELERALFEITDEIELLEAERRRVKHSLVVLMIPESIAGEFLQLRSTRLEPDLVRDPVEDELVKEVALCSEVRNILVTTREQIEIQLVELKTIKARMELDLTDKKDAYNVESHCVGLTNDTPLIMLKAGATRVPPEQSTPADYDQFTREALEAAETIRQKSVDLRSNLDSTYLKTIRDLRTQAIRVDTALAEKIHITEQVCQQLEAELIRCLTQLSSTEDLIEELRGSAKRVNDALKVAQTRLDDRLLRRNVENCRDVPQYGLIEEVKTLGENLSLMDTQLKEAQHAQAGLVKSRSDLEGEIAVKKKSLYVDRDRGQLLRSFYPSAEELSGHAMAQSTICQELHLTKTKNSTDSHDPSKKIQKSQEKYVNQKIDYSRSDLHELKTGALKPTESPNKALKTQEPTSEDSKNLTLNFADSSKSTQNIEENSAPVKYFKSLTNLNDSREAEKKCWKIQRSPAEWRLENECLLQNSHQNVNKQMVEGFDAKRSMKRIFAQTDKDCQDNNMRFSSRLGLIGRWELELHREIRELEIEFNCMQEERKRFYRSLHALKLVESINKDVRAARCSRDEFEFVFDAVEDELRKELNLCADVGKLYTKCVDQIKQQLQKLKESKERLEIDYTDKKEAWDIDVTCRGLNCVLSIVDLKSANHELPANQSTPRSYENYCKEAINISQQILEKSRILRSNFRDIFDKSVKDLRKQADRVETSITNNIDEMEVICRRIEHELSQSLKALSEAEILVNKTRDASKTLEGTMRCAQTLFDLRLQRNKIENCCDSPQFGLIEELKTLSNGANVMLSQTERANNAIEDLTKMRRNLEKNLAANRQSIFIDRERCRVLRTFYPTIQMLAGHS